MMRGEEEVVESGGGEWERRPRRRERPHRREILECL
jgi:hypothetical protein